MSEEKDKQVRVKTSFRFDDSVIARIVQILQEGMIMGVDVTDLMRQIRVEEATDGESLVQTEAYRLQVKETHDKLLKQADELKAKRQPVAASGLVLN
jgi:exoribonuclease R